jgi:mannose/fructose/N-acetylgalactosamine-specific phosphotransferase system component IIC
MGAYVEKMRRDWTAVSRARRITAVVASVAAIVLVVWSATSGVFARSDISLAVARLMAATALYLVIRAAMRRRHLD